MLFSHLRSFHLLFPSSLSLHPFLSSRLSCPFSRAACCIAVYRRDRWWRNLPSDRHAVNEHVDRSRFAHSSRMACRVAITVAAAIDIAPETYARESLLGEKNEMVRFCTRRPIEWRGKYCVERPADKIFSKLESRWMWSKCCLRTFLIIRSQFLFSIHS